MLVAGDIVAYIFSIVITLIIRYGHVPDRNIFMTHVLSFSFLFAVFLVVSFSAGLYDKQSGIIKGRVHGMIVKVQIINLAIGISFFYLAPVLITPKTNLLIYFAVSTAMLFVWRLVMFPVFNRTRNHQAVLVGSGDDIQDLHDEIISDSHYGITLMDHIIPTDSVQTTREAIFNAVKNTKVSTIIADLNNPSVQSAMSLLYSLIFSGVRVIDASKLYEMVFDRIPISMVGERWLVEHSGTALGSRRAYDVFKRLMDIVIAGSVGVISLVLYPFVYLAIYLDDGGAIFVTQDRIGKNGKTIRMNKFRSMSANDQGMYNHNDGKTDLSITRVGQFIRMTRIDELPQLWSVIKGEQSLIGPRPELPALVKIYEKEIPYYNARHLVKPGLSGWAQIYHRAHPHHFIAINDTRDKLSYDLYYIKHRSLALDIRIALQTFKALVSKRGV